MPQIRTAEEIASVIGVEQILDAMDGVTYLVSTGGHILAVGTPGWNRFAKENMAIDLSQDLVVGREFFSMFRGDAVKDAYRGMREKLCRDMNAHIIFEYRCDSVDTERLLRMSIGAIQGETGAAAILYQSQTVREIERVPMMLFSQQNYRKSWSDDDLVSLCSYCHNVAWPVGAQKTDREWISPHAYYARGGSAEAVVSHGICPGCHASIVTPNI